MKNFVLLVIVAGIGYYAYTQWSPAPAPAEREVAPARAEPVDFAVKSTVNRLFSEWKRRELSGQGRQHGSAFMDMSQGITEIRRKLFAMGIHSEKAVSQTIARALRELGVADDECAQIASGILSAAQSDAARSSARTAAPPNANPPRSGLGSVGGGD